MLGHSSDQQNSDDEIDIDDIEFICTWMVKSFDLSTYLPLEDRNPMIYGIDTPLELLENSNAQTLPVSTTSPESSTSSPPRRPRLRPLPRPPTPRPLPRRPPSPRMLPTPPGSATPSARSKPPGITGLRKWSTSPGTPTSRKPLPFPPLKYHARHIPDVPTDIGQAEYDEENWLHSPALKKANIPTLQKLNISEVEEYLQRQGFTFPAFPEEPGIPEGIPQVEAGRSERYRRNAKVSKAQGKQNTCVATSEDIISPWAHVAGTGTYAKSNADKSRSSGARADEGRQAALSSRHKRLAASHCPETRPASFPPSTGCETGSGSETLEIFAEVGAVTELTASKLPTSMKASGPKHLRTKRRAIYKNRPPQSKQLAMRPQGYTMPPGVELHSFLRTDNVPKQTISLQSTPSPALTVRPSDPGAARYDDPSLRRYAAAGVRLRVPQPKPLSHASQELFGIQARHPNPSVERQASQHRAASHGTRNSNPNLSGQRPNQASQLFPPGEGICAPDQIPTSSMAEIIYQTIVQPPTAESLADMAPPRWDREDESMGRMPPLRTLQPGRRAPAAPMQQTDHVYEEAPPWPPGGARLQLQLREPDVKSRGRHVDNVSLPKVPMGRMSRQPAMINSFAPTAPPGLPTRPQRERVASGGYSAAVTRSSLETRASPASKPARASNGKASRYPPLPGLHSSLPGPARRSPVNTHPDNSHLYHNAPKPYLPEGLLSDDDPWIPPFDSASEAKPGASSENIESSSSPSVPKSRLAPGTARRGSVLDAGNVLEEIMSRQHSGIY